MKNAYQTRENYAGFLAQLEQAEREVNQAALQTVRTSSASQIVEKMEETTGKIRRLEMDRSFSLTESITHGERTSKS